MFLQDFFPKYIAHVCGTRILEKQGQQQTTANEIWRQWLAEEIRGASAKLSTEGNEWYCCQVQVSAIRL
jgi:hypothetical protein